MRCVVKALRLDVTSNVSSGTGVILAGYDQTPTRTYLVNDQGTLQIGGTLTSTTATNSPNIELNNDGTSSFSNTMSLGAFNTSSTTATGVDINAYGRIRVQRTASNVTDTVVDLRHGTKRSVRWTAEGKLYMGEDVDDLDLAGTTNIL